MRGPGRLRRTGGVFTAVLGLSAGALSAVAAAPAAALTPPVGFTADHLSTYRTNGIVRSLAEANGVVYAGGTFSTVRPAGSPAGSDTTPAVNFAAFDAATGAPTGCSLSFTRSSGTATVRALAVSADRSTLYAGGYLNVNGVAANTNHNDSQLASRGTTAYLGYLRLALPEAPAGQVLKSARLAFRTSSDPTAGSAESHSIVPVTGTWTESAVTYNTRPTLAASVLGTITAASQVSTDHSVDLDASALEGALGSLSSLALTSSGTDSPRIWSSEATAAYRPQLVLTFGAE